MDLAVVKDDNLDIIRQILQKEEERQDEPRYWVGLSTSKYIWEKNGKEMDHTLFGCGEPSHSSERCIEMLADSKYNDTRCEEKRPYICEWVHKGHEMLDIGCLGERCFYYVKEPMTWGEANRTCGQYSDTFLASIPDYHTQFYLNSMVTKLYLTKRKDQSAIMGRLIQVQNGFWIGARYKFGNYWTFMDGEVFTGDIRLANPYTYYHCGAVTVGDDIFQGLLCDDKRRFLCLTTDPHADVLREENHFISSAQTQQVDWFRARTNCLDRGMDLASGSMELLQQVLTGETGSFWIGLLKSGFVWEHNNKPVTHMQFRCDEPNNYKETDEHCVEMWLDGEYNDNICTALKPMVCEWDRAPVTPSPAKPPFFTSKSKEPQDHTWMYAAIVGLVGWALTFICFVGLSVKMYKTTSELKDKLAAFQAVPMSNCTNELDNQDDPILLLSDELNRILLNAAPDIHRHLPLSTDTRLWAILKAKNVVDQVNKEYIQGNNNTKTNVDQVAALIEHLQRGTNMRYYTFRGALLQGGYDSVVRHYLDNAPGSPQSAALLPPTPNGSCSFNFPPKTPDPGEVCDSREEEASSSSTIKPSTCASSSVLNSLGRSLRDLLPDPSKSHISTSKDVTLCPDEESSL